MAKAIPASYIVSVNPRVMYGASGTLVMSGLLLTDNALQPFPQLLSFPGADEVGEYFGVDTEEYRLATKYFLGFDNSYRKPENCILQGGVKLLLAVVSLALLLPLW